MNIEELKMVIELVRQISGDASNVALWYFGMKFAETLIVLFVLIGAILWVVRQIIKANFCQDEEFIKECRDTLRIGHTGSLMPGERKATHRFIRALIAEKTK
jgi:hypothetical protein